MKTSFREFLLESLGNILTDGYFIKRVPFFKMFDNNSDNKTENIQFEYFKNWQGNNSATIPFGKGNGFVRLKYLSIEIKFVCYNNLMRDFDNEKGSPKFKKKYYFIYNTDIHMNLPEIEELDEVKNQIVALMLKDIMKNEYKFSESFDVLDGEELPMDKIDNIINLINKNCYQLEEVLGKMNLEFFN